MSFQNLLHQSSWLWERQMNCQFLLQQSSWLWERQMNFQFLLQQSIQERQMNFQNLLHQSGQELHLWSMIPTSFRHPYLQRQRGCPS